MADVGAAKPYHRAGAGVRFAVRHIRDHLDEPLADNHLAQRAGMSRTAFDRHFKATTTLSPHLSPRDDASTVRSIPEW